MEEETTLTSQSVALLREGKPFVFSDESIGREWTIYPFAFRLKTAEEGGKGEAGIKIDWEHDSWDWYDPMEVEDTPAFGGVPRIAESLRRVWFEKDVGETAGRILGDGLERLRADNEGSSEPSSHLPLEILRDVALGTDSPGLSWDEWWRRTRLAAWHIWTNGNQNTKPATLATLHSALTGVENKVSDQGLSTAAKVDTATKELASLATKEVAQRHEDLDLNAETERLFGDL